MPKFSTLPSPSRRTAIFSLAAVGMTAAAIVPVAAALAAPGASPTLARLWAAREAALAAQAVATKAETAAFDRYAASKPVFPEDLKLGWQALLGLPAEKEWLKELRPREGMRDLYIFSAENWRNIEARVAANPKSDPENLATVRRRRDLASSHERATYEAHETAGVDPAVAALDDAFAKVCDIEDAIFDMPVACAADLAIKALILQQRIEAKRDLPDDYVARLLADVSGLPGMPTAA